MSSYPLLFEPILKDYIWGGRNLATKLGRTLPADTNIAESWEIAAHKDGTAVVTNGPHSGKPLTTLLDEMGLALIGHRSQWALDRQKFPLLIKILDANRNLSVQVHPDDAYALENEGNELGKTEMWVILHAEPEAKVILGVSAGTTPEAFRQAILDGRLEPHLHQIEVKTGDHINVPAGSLHAIMGGLLIAEIQQNSNTTYRVYDWNRMGADGQPRPLHIDKALAVTNFSQIEPTVSASALVAETAAHTRTLLCENRYFTVERVKLNAGSSYEGVCDGQTFEIWGVINGSATVTGGETAVDLNAVQFTLLPANIGRFTIESTESAEFIRAYVAQN